jgi:hypothetical protein
VQNFAIQGELNHRLRSLDRRNHSGIQAILRHVHPFQDIADVIALSVKGSIHIQRNLQFAYGDLCLDRQLRRVRLHLALMRAVLVKGINARADNLFGVEGWPEGANSAPVDPTN